jgi:hypothetical protein
MNIYLNGNLLTSIADLFPNGTRMPMYYNYNTPLVPFINNRSEPTSQRFLVGIVFEHQSSCLTCFLGRRV